MTVRPRDGRSAAHWASERLVEAADDVAAAAGTFRMSGVRSI